jgi:EAL domain-containing protein (putative c-di-GMP-specific phosphodiesterase class I)
MSVDALKIDRSFVENLDRSPQSFSIVRAIVAMAKAFGLRVVADGVDSEDQAEVLRLLGCDAAQGCLFGRAGTPDFALKRVTNELAQ